MSILNLWPEAKHGGTWPLIPAPGGLDCRPASTTKRHVSKTTNLRFLGHWGGREVLRAALSDLYLISLSTGILLQHVAHSGLPAQPCWPVCRGRRTHLASTWPVQARAWSFASVSETCPGPPTPCFLLLHSGSGDLISVLWASVGRVRPQCDPCVECSCPRELTHHMPPNQSSRAGCDCTCNPSPREGSRTTLSSRLAWP